LLAAAALALGGVAAALGAGIGLATVDEAETIHACAKTSGDLRLVDEPGECKKKERAVSWNTTGPAGPPGERGEPGAPGAPGLADLQTVWQTSDVPTSEANRNGFLASVHCPADTVATGGGFRVNGGGIYVKASQPIAGPGLELTPIGWHAMFAYLPDVPNPPPASAEVTVWAVCGANSG
jgi:hypothetical protein